MTTKTYTVTFSPAENVYDEAQLLKSIFESIDAVADAEVQDGDNSPAPETEESTKGDSIA